MVTAYYIMKMSKNHKNMDINDYYSDIQNESNLKSVFHKDQAMCRVCMKEGSIPIDFSENSYVVEALRSFANLDISEDDDYPKHLCRICHKFIKGAILFKKIAEQTDKILKTPVKEEALESPDHDYSEEIDNKESVKAWPVTVTSDKQSDKHKNYKTKTMSKVQCYVCNKVVNKSYYKEHLTMHDPNHHKYVCDICGKSFRLRCAYHNHSLRHGNGFPFKCKLCPYKGKYAELLKTHMRTHTGDYRYMCTECPARFLFKSNLNSHVLNKHKEREHKCDACKRAFHTKLALQRHFEVDHLGVKTHVCNICGNAFGYRNAMMKHQRRVHKREKMMFSRMPSYLQAENKNQGIQV